MRLWSGTDQSDRLPANSARPHPNDGGAGGGRVRVSSRVIIAAVLIFALGGFVVLLGIDLLLSGQREQEMAQRDAANLTRVLERQIVATVEKIDIVLSEAAADYAPTAATMARPTVEEANRDLLRRMQYVPEAQSESLRVVDAEGHVVYSAGATGALPNVVVADRSYFLRQKTDPGAGLVLSEPIYSRFTSAWVMTLSRRMNRADGSFGGVVQAAVRADYFQTLFESLNVGSGGSIGLYDSQMRLIARQPVLPEQVGKPYAITEIADALVEGKAMGSYSVVSRIDGVLRDYVWRKTASHPLIILLGQSPDEVFYNWRRKALIYALSVLALALELAALIVLQQRAAKERIRYLARFDPLTNLPNRSVLDERMAEATEAGGGELAALLLIDLDHFKNINDSLGHDVGDRVLHEVAGRLRRVLRDADTVSRQGGDEFVVLLRKGADADEIAHVVQRLRQEIAKPIDLAGHELVLTASAGISVYPADGSDLGTLLKNADAAMYQAKAAGRNTYRFFTNEMNTRVSERLVMENSLRKALARGELAIHYQPQFDAVSHALIGFEALLRWNNPDLGPVSPARFIPIAEESGLIIPIGQWVLAEACRQNKAWQDDGLPPVCMAVNLSAVQFRQPDFVASVADVLAHSGLDPRWLELEVTESALMDDIERVICVLHDLKAIGIQLSIDDFGTGYSSLNYLKRFPTDKIKIDQSFVRDVTSSPDDAAIVQTVIAIASTMNMRVIAEGVETDEHLETMRSFGCDEVQGFLFSPAVDADEARHFFAGSAEDERRLKVASA